MIIMKFAPRMYRNTQWGVPKDLLGANKYVKKKARIPCLDTEHSKIVGMCFTWELVLPPQQPLWHLQNLIE